MVGGIVRNKVTLPNGKKVWRKGKVINFHRKEDVSSIKGHPCFTYTIQYEDAAIGTRDGQDPTHYFEVLQNANEAKISGLTEPVQELSIQALKRGVAADILDDSVWKTATALRPSTDGMNGVIFVQTSGGIIVLKSSVRSFKIYLCIPSLSCFFFNIFLVLMNISMRLYFSKMTAALVIVMIERRTLFTKFMALD